MEKSNHNEEKSESSPLLSSLDVKVPVLEGSVTESPRYVQLENYSVTSHVTT